MKSVVTFIFLFIFVSFMVGLLFASFGKLNTPAPPLPPAPTDMEEFKKVKQSWENVKEQFNKKVDKVKGKFGK